MVSDFPRKYLLAGAKLDVKLPITRSQSDKYANPGDVWHLREEGGETEGKASNCTLGIPSMCGGDL